MKPEFVSRQLTEAIRELDPQGNRIARMFRETFDQAYHGQHTGRYAVEQLTKTEKAHIGSLVEINLRRELDGFISDGNAMDFKILEHEVDCKFSLRPFAWMIPSETIGHHAMLCHADDAKSTWTLGFVKVTDEILNTGNNRDQKRSISAKMRGTISWAWEDHPMPPNVLLRLEPDALEKVLSGKTGQQRLNNLFRVAEGTLIPRGIVATVARQKDYMKRIRGNGGSRSILRNEGYIILGDYGHHREIAAALNLEVPAEGDSISVRVFPAEPDYVGPVANIDGKQWRRATQEDPPTLAPQVPHRNTV